MEYGSWSLPPSLIPCLSRALLPHINYPAHNFTVRALKDLEQSALFMGLDQIKELTHQTIQRIIRFAPFETVEDFLTRVDPRPHEAENLARVGALEGLGNIPSILRRLQSGGWQQNQLSLFGWADSGEEVGRYTKRLRRNWSCLV